MSPFEYLLLFAAVILGLAISELAIATHRLVSAGARVRWDWLAPLAAIVVFLKIITQWWAWYAAEALPGGLRFEMFIGVVIGGVLLFLLAATALPVAHGPVEISLADHYQQVRRRFWLLFAAHWVVVTAVSTWAQVSLVGARYSGPSWGYLVVPAALALAFIRSWWLHGLALLTFTGLYVTQFFGQQLVHR
jgi:hypothetical protein